LEYSKKQIGQVTQVRASISAYAVKAALSTARISTYETACTDSSSALALYSWNAQVSGALLTPLHICEVIIRNAVSDALESLYGERWPWSTGFERSLPDPAHGYSPTKDLQNARRRAITTGKVIPELKFVFWQKMFTSRYDARLWNSHLIREFPNLDSSIPINNLRSNVYNELEIIRKLRNRIAHHEPIFNRNLDADFQNITELINSRCEITSTWMVNNQQALSLINSRP